MSQDRRRPNFDPHHYDDNSNPLRYSEQQHTAGEQRRQDDPTSLGAWSDQNFEQTQRQPDRFAPTGSYNTADEGNYNAQDYGAQGYDAQETYDSADPYQQQQQQEYWPQNQQPYPAQQPSGHNDPYGYPSNQQVTRGQSAEAANQQPHDYTQHPQPSFSQTPKRPMPTAPYNKGTSEQRWGYQGAYPSSEKAMPNSVNETVLDDYENYDQNSQQQPYQAAAQQAQSVTTSNTKPAKGTGFASKLGFGKKNSEKTLKPTPLRSQNSSKRNSIIVGGVLVLGIVVLAAVVLLSFSQPSGPSQADIREAQEILSAINYYSAPIDGQFSAQLEEAIQQFQVDFNSDSIDGQISANLLEQLRQINAVMN